MSAYLLAKVEITDMDQYQQYMKKTPEAIEKYGGKFIVRGGEMVTLEGPEETRRLVLVEFPSLERAKEFYHSQEYGMAKKLREGAAMASIIALEGV